MVIPQHWSDATTNKEAKPLGGAVGGGGGASRHDGGHDGGTGAMMYKMDKTTGEKKGLSLCRATADRQSN